jgi:sn-glycerol 3-phosphate transport system permease protein
MGTPRMAELAVRMAGAGTSVRVARRRARHFLGLALLSPSLVFLAAFTYWPTAQVIWQSLYAGSRRAGTFGLGNYQALAADPAFRRALSNNAAYAVGTIVPSLVLALAFALTLVHSTRLNALLRSIFFLPVLIPLVAAASLFLFIFLPGVGLLDYYLAKLGVQGANWLGDPDVALYSIIGLTIWKNAGYYMLFFLAGLQAIPAALLEASAIDGATPRRRFWTIVFPLLAPTTFFLVIVNMVYAFFDTFGVIHNVTQGGPDKATEILVYKVWYDGIVGLDLGGSAAQSVVLMAIVIGLTAIQFRFIERRVHYA